MSTRKHGDTDYDNMSTTNEAETLKYRAELDRLYQLSRRRAASQVPEGTVPAEEEIAEQKRRTDELARDALASEGDVRELCASVAHETTRGYTETCGYVEEFLAQSSIDHDDIVCVRGATGGTYRMLLYELLSALEADPVTVPVSAAVEAAGTPTVWSNGAGDPSPNGRRDASTQEGGAVDPAETAARIIAVLVDMNLKARHPVVDLGDVAQAEPSVPLGRVVELVLSGMREAGIGGVVRLPDSDALGADGLGHGASVTYTIDLRETDAGTEARMIGADSEGFSGDWWLLWEA